MCMYAMDELHTREWVVRKSVSCGLTTDSELAEPGFWSKHLQRARRAQSASQLQEAPSGQTGPFPGRYTRPRRDASARLEARHGLSCGMPAAAPRRRDEG